MKLSELKEKVEKSIIYEFCSKIYLFLKEYKFMTIVLVSVILGIAVMLSPIMYRLVYQNPSSDQSNIANTGIYEDAVTVCVAGEVQNPGNYTLTSDDRIEDAIEMAGGLTDNADTSDINLAQRLSDEQYIKIPSIQAENSSSSDNHSSAETSKEILTGIVNINTASAAELQQLPGIGEVTANRIIEYRNNVGTFADKRDIMNVKGIGNSIYDKIKNNITI